MICLFVFTATYNTSDSDSEIVIASRSTAELNRADTVVHQLLIYFNTLFMNAFIDLSMTILTTFHHDIYILYGVREQLSKLLQIVDKLMRF